MQEEPGGYGFISKLNGQFHSGHLDNLGNILSSQLLPFSATAIYMAPDGHFITYDSLARRISKSPDSVQLAARTLGVICNQNSDLRILFRNSDNGFIFRCDGILVKLGPNGELPHNFHSYNVRLMLDADEDCTTIGTIPLVANALDPIELRALDGSRQFTATPDSAGNFSWLSMKPDTFVLSFPKRLEGIGYAICSNEKYIHPNRNTIQEITIALGTSNLNYQALENTLYVFDSLQGSYRINSPFCSAAMVMHRRDSMPCNLQVTAQAQPF